MKRSPFFIIYVVLFFSLLLNACGPKAAAIPPLSAALSELQGTVLAKQADQAGFTRVSSGFVLQQNGQIQTGDDGRVRLDLSTGTIFRVAPSSLFTLVSNTQTDQGLASHLKLDAGKLWIILKGGSVDVETPSGVASVRGSYLMVEVIDNGAIKLTCLEGDCSLHNDSGDFPLTTGQTAIVLNAQVPPFIQAMTDQEVQEWLDANPEAVIVVPSLTLPPPSATTESTATTEPTFTSIPDTATSEPTSTTEPTATNVPPTATAQTYYNPPPAKPPKPAPTPDPNALVYLVSNIDINGGRFGVHVSPGGTVTVQFIYILWNQAVCPLCIDQLVVGLDDGGVKTGYGCGYDGTPGAYPGTSSSYLSSSPVTFSAPTSPGTYSIGIDLIQDYGCLLAIPSYGLTGNYSILGTIIVP